jgi:hypothetical protein
MVYPLQSGTWLFSDPNYQTFNMICTELT